MQTISVVVVNYNGRDFLKKCLDSVTKQTLKPCEIIVVDNGSNDGSQKMVKEEFPQILLIENENNLYYAKAMNQGIRKAKGKWILCLNNDVRLREDFLEECIKATGKNTRIGMVCGKVYSMRKQGFLDSCGQELSVARTPIDRGYRRKDNGRFNSEGYVFGPGGVAAFYRREMLEELRIGNEYFDEDYGIFYEDLDIAWRANKLGWKCLYTPKAVAEHNRSTATVKRKCLWPRYILPILKDELKSMAIINRYRTIAKNENLRDFMKNFFPVLFYEIKLWLYMIILDRKALCEVLRRISTIKTSVRKRRRCTI